MHTREQQREEERSKGKERVRVEEALLSLQERQEKKFSHEDRRKK